MRAVYTDGVDVNKGIVTIVSSTTPASLAITGADVDGLPDDFVVAAGSVIVTPDASYIAFEDGVFTEKSNPGGGSGGGGGGSDIFEVDFTVTYIDDTDVVTSTKTAAEIAAAQAAGKIIVAKCFFYEQYPEINAYAVYADEYGVDIRFMYIEEGPVLISSKLTFSAGRWEQWFGVYTLTPAEG